MYYINPHS